MEGAGQREREDADECNCGAAEEKASDRGASPFARSDEWERQEESQSKRHANCLLGERYTGRQDARSAGPTGRLGSTLRSVYRQQDERHRKRCIEVDRTQRKQEHRGQRDEGGGEVGRGTDSGTLREIKGSGRRDSVEDDDRCSRNEDAFTKHPKEKCEELEREGPRKEDNVPIEVLACYEPLRYVDCDALFEQVGLESRHRGARERAREPPSYDCDAPAHLDPPTSVQSLERCTRYIGSARAGD